MVDLEQIRALFQSPLSNSILKSPFNVVTMHLAWWTNRQFWTDLLFILYSVTSRITCKTIIKLGILKGKNWKRAQIRKQVWVSFQSFQQRETLLKLWHEFFLKSISFSSKTLWTSGLTQNAKHANLTCLVIQPYKKLWTS